MAHVHTPEGAASVPAAHDHVACVRTAIAEAERVCDQRGVRLTVLRRRVLELVWLTHRPRGAYAILEDLGRDGRTPAPLTVYRALEFLQAQGLVHRIESLNAFVGCARPGARHSSQFLVCSTCGDATELNDGRVTEAIRATATDLGFQISRQTVEVHGICPRCQGEQPSSAAADPS